MVLLDRQPIVLVVTHQDDRSLGAAYYWSFARFLVSTDDAYVQADSTDARERPYAGTVAELAPGKVRTAALFKKPSQDLEDAINNGRIAATTARGFIEMQGALPVIVDGEGDRGNRRKRGYQGA